MEKVLKSNCLLNEDNPKITFENVTFSTTMRGLDILYRTASGSFPLDVYLDGRLAGTASLTTTAGYRELEVIHADIPEIQPGAYEVSFVADKPAYIESFIFTETFGKTQADTRCLCTHIMKQIMTLSRQRIH